MNYISVIANFNICIECAKDYKLKKYIEMSNSNISECNLCNTKNKTLELSNNPDFANFIRALIRYHYWEDEYNTHFGGDSINDIFLNENPIIYHERIVDDSVLDDLIGIIKDYKFDTAEDIVELWYGHIDGVRWSFGERIKDKKDNYISQLEKDLLEKNHFLLEESFKEKILNFVDYLSNNINIDSIYYRARIGYKEKIKNNNSNYLDKSTDFVYEPYKYQDIGSVPIKKSQEGRLNKKGESFLYLATDIETAISEVRPDPGHIVSIAKFKSVNNIKVVDFDKAFILLSENENTIKEFTFLAHIEQILSHPVTKDEKHLYFISQFFADVFRKIGFDGVLFSSSISQGQNLVLFDPNNFIYIENSSKVFDIKSLKYTYNELLVNKEEN